ncbi:MAG: diphthine synthase [Candidatus Hermodarchaeota archaeon]
MDKKRGRLIFIGLGLCGFKDLSLKAIEALKRSDEIFFEGYTNFIDETTVEKLEQNVSVPIRQLQRKEMEEEAEKLINVIGNRVVSLIVPGDPFTATTHSILRILAVEKGIRTEIIHNSSIFSAVPSVLGLSAYRFGRTATIPLSESKHPPSIYPYNIAAMNRQIKAHTLFLLDIDLQKNTFLTISEALQQLQYLEEQHNQKLITHRSIWAGIAKIGYKDPMIKVGGFQKISNVNWREIGPPQCLVLCDRYLDIIEKEFLEKVWKVPQIILQGALDL